MKRSRFSEEQVIAILKEQESGVACLISAHQLHRSLGVTYKTAWFMFHRIREAMRCGDLAPMGGGGGYVEADETFIGREPGGTKAKNARAWGHKIKVLSLIDRATGEARSVVVDNLKASTVAPILNEKSPRKRTSAPMKAASTS